MRGFNQAAAEPLTIEAQEAGAVYVKTVVVGEERRQTPSLISDGGLLGSGETAQRGDLTASAAAMMYLMEIDGVSRSPRLERTGDVRWRCPQPGRGLTLELHLGGGDGASGQVIGVGGVFRIAGEHLTGEHAGAARKWCLLGCVGVGAGARCGVVVAPSGFSQGDDVAIADDLGVLLVDFDVVVSAGQGKVVEVGAPAVLPRHEVVRFAPVGRSLAAIARPCLFT